MNKGHERSTESIFQNINIFLKQIIHVNNRRTHVHLIIILLIQWLNA
jgi:hypothetical protein